MNSGTFLRLSQYREFWRWRAKIQRIQFGALGRLFRLRYLIRDERTNTGILLSFVRLTGLQLFFAIGIAAALQIIELLLVPAIVDRWATPDSANYVTWLGIIAQIGGVFIALYFTAVTAAAGAIYAQVPNNIRDLLARERVGNIYIRYLTIATFLPLCLVALHLFGFEPLRIAVPALVLLAGVGIIAFAALGQRAFNLFDPTKLAGALFGDFGGWLAQVSAGGFRWQDRSFQAHAHRQTASILDTLQTLSDLAATHANLDSAPLLELSVSVLALLADYQHRKLRIPTDSFWFEQKYEHKTWYQTEDTAVQIAHNTGTTLSPTSVPEYNWLEDRLEAIPLRCFELNLGRERLDNVRDLMAGMDSYVASLVTNGNVRRAAALAQKILDVFEKTRSSAPSDSGQEQRAEDTGMVDVVCFLQLRVLVAYRASLEQRTPDRTRDRLERLRWDETKSLYVIGFVTEELKQLEWLLPRIQLELAVEGSGQTPLWYQHELVSKSQAESLGKSIEAIVDGGVKFFQNWSDQLIAAGHIYQSAAVLSRYIEYLNKLETYHLPFFRKYFDSLIATKHLTDLPWPEVKPELWSKTVRASRTKLTLTIANRVILLSALPQLEGVPDYLGQFIHETGESVFGALLDKRVGEVRVLIKSYLVGTLSLFDKMKPKAAKFDVWTEQKFQIAAAPVLDILELSGYGKLLAELHADERLWVAISEVWDQFLQDSPGSLSWLAAINLGGIPRFQIPHRGLLRTNWSMRIQQELNKLPRHHSMGGGTMGGGTDGIFSSDRVDHPSPLVRYCARYSFHNGRDIFAALYLSKQPGADKVQWDRGVRDLGESLKREEKLYTENGEDDQEQ